MSNFTLYCDVVTLHGRTNNSSDLQKVRIFNTSMGGQVMIVNGYRFHREYGTVGRSYWRCTKRRSYSCKCNLKIIDGKMNFIGLNKTINLTHSDPSESLESDDDVIEVIRDEAPIEILSDGEELERELSKGMNLNSQSFDFMSALEMNESPKVLEDPLRTSSIEEPVVPFIVTSTSLLNNVDKVIDTLSNNIENVNVTDVNIGENTENVGVTDTNPNDNIENVNITDTIPIDNMENVNVTDINPNDNIENVNITDINPNDNTENVDVTNISPNDNIENVNITDINPNENIENVNVTDHNLSDSGENINVTDVETEKLQKTNEKQALQYDTNSSESNVHVDDI